MQNRRSDPNHEIRDPALRAIAAGSGHNSKLESAIREAAARPLLCPFPLSLTVNERFEVLARKNLN
jgi:hypothetical protein